jgi:hypothetical protein
MPEIEAGLQMNSAAASVPYCPIPAALRMGAFLGFWISRLMIA